MYLAQGKALIFLLSVPLTALMLFQSKILEGVGQPQPVCDLVFWYSVGQAPGLIFEGLVHLRVCYII